MSLKSKLKKAVKKVGKAVKKVAKVHPLSPTGPASKIQKKLAKAALPIAAGAIAGPAASALSNGMPSGITGILGGADDFIGGLTNALAKAKQIAAAIDGDTPKAAPGPANPGVTEEQQFAPGISPMIVLGAVGVLAVIVLARK